MVVYSFANQSSSFLTRVLRLAVCALAMYGAFHLFESHSVSQYREQVLQVRNELPHNSQPAAITVNEAPEENEVGQHAKSTVDLACSNMVVTTDGWTFAPEGSLPNPRAVLRGKLQVSVEESRADFKVYHATGRPFVVAKQALLADKSASACIAAVAKKSLKDEVFSQSFGTWSNGKVDPRLVEPEPSWVEWNVVAQLQLPWAREFVGADPLGKLYLDTDTKSGGFEGKKPTMLEIEYNGWAKTAEVFNNGGRHLDFGTGSSSHYACGVYAHVNAIDSQKQYCDLVQSELAKAQSRCGKIEMNCVDVGALADWGAPVKGKTDVSFYFSQYVNAVDGFRNSPYYDSILVDGRFRVACAIKSLKYLRRDSVFFIHDWPRSYRLIEEYADHLESFGTLALLAPKANLTAGSDAEYQRFQGVQ